MRMESFTGGSSSLENRLKINSNGGPLEEATLSKWGDVRHSMTRLSGSADRVLSRSCKIRSNLPALVSSEFGIRCNRKRKGRHRSALFPWICDRNADT